MLFLLFSIFLIITKILVLMAYTDSIFINLALSKTIKSVIIESDNTRGAISAEMKSISDPLNL